MTEFYSLALINKLSNAFIVFTSIIGLTTIIINCSEYDFFLSNKYIKSLNSLEHCISNIERKINITLKTQQYIIKQIDTTLLYNNNNNNKHLHVIEPNILLEPILSNDVIGNDLIGNDVIGNDVIGNKEDELLFNECYKNIPLCNKKSVGMKGWFYN